MHKRLETQHGQLSVQERTLTEVRRALEKAGVEFIAENGGGDGVRMKKLSGKKTPPSGVGTSETTISLLLGAANVHFADRPSARRKPGQQ
jgi:hypothetical protein